MKWWIKTIVCFTLLVLAIAAQAQSPSTVLVVANANNANSVALAQYYMQARKVPAQNLLLLNWTAADSADTCNLAVYKASIAAPIYAKIRTLRQIDYIVLCRNLPVKIAETQGSVDSALATNTTSKAFNPYNCETVAFTSKSYGMYLVTRLDGWSWADAAALVDRSMMAKPGGLFFMDEDPTRGGGYAYYNTIMGEAHQWVANLKASTQLDTTIAFCGPAPLLGGYISWGSNDHHFSAQTYNALKFAPGAIVETLVSTSAMYLRTPPTGVAQSQIAQLVHNGVTGIKGYVAEPYVDATADPRLLFQGYITGLNLAEAFYSASTYVGWKDVVLGDPLCRPYIGTSGH